MGERQPGPLPCAGASVGWTVQRQPLLAVGATDLEKAAAARESDDEATTTTKDQTVRHLRRCSRLRCAIVDGSVATLLRVLLFVPHHSSFEMP